MKSVKGLKQKTRPITGKDKGVFISSHPHHFPPCDFCKGFTEIKHIDDNCICDKCIKEYLDFYEKIEKLEDERLVWRAKFSREKKDKINTILSRRIKDKSKN